MKAIHTFNDELPSDRKAIADRLMKLIDEHFNATECKIWHAHPVWFINGNPIVGYSNLKGGVRLMFWSGAYFDEDGLTPGTGKYMDASVVYTSSGQIDESNIKRWLKKSEKIQWDYKNIYKTKGVLNKLSCFLF